MTDQYKKAYLYAIKLLTKRDYSQPKLRQKMVEKRFDTEVIDKVIEELEAKNFIREENYVEARIKAFMHKRYSPHFIAQKLAQEDLNIDIEQIKAIFLDYQITTEQQVDELIKKKFPLAMAQSDDPELFQKFKRRTLQYIVGKGHTLSLGVNRIAEYIKKAKS